MPIQSPNGLCPPSQVPFHGWVKEAPCVASLLNRPWIPPVSFSTTMTTGIRASRMTKNCITSL